MEDETDELDASIILHSDSHLPEHQEIKTTLQILPQGSRDTKAVSTRQNLLVSQTPGAATTLHLSQQLDHIQSFPDFISISRL